MEVRFAEYVTVCHPERLIQVNGSIDPLIDSRDVEACHRLSQLVNPEKVIIIKVKSESTELDTVTYYLDQKTHQL